MRDLIVSLQTACTSGQAMPRPARMLAMASDSDTCELEKRIQNRLGSRGNGTELARAYLDGAREHAINRTLGNGPVPTTLAAERAALLVVVSKKLNRLIEDFEIQALLRLAPAQASSLLRTLLATYADDAHDLLQQWSLHKARKDGRAKASNFGGTKIVFSSKDRRDNFVQLQEQQEIDVEIVDKDDEHNWVVIVGDQFPKDRLPPS